MENFKLYTNNALLDALVENIHCKNYNRIWPLADIQKHRHIRDEILKRMVDNNKITDKLPAQ